MLTHAGIKFDWKLVSMLRGENFEEEFKQLSPSGHLPLLLKDNQIVLSQGNLLFEWVSMKHPEVSSMFDHQSQKETLNAMRNYFYRKMRNITSTLIRRTALVKIQPEQAAKLSQESYMN